MYTAFNRPPDGGQTSILQTFLFQIFSCVQASSAVHGSMFHWNDVGFTTSLARVVAPKKLILHLVAGDSGMSVPREVKEFFRDYVTDGGVWQRRPMGRRNHDKWFLFDALDFDLLRTLGLHPNIHATQTIRGVRQALFLSTNNLSTEDPKKHNAAVLIPVDSRLANPLKERVETLKLCYKFGWIVKPIVKDRLDYVTAEDEHFKLYLYPRKSGADVVKGILENMDPSSTSRTGSSSIQVSNNRWNRVKVADQLCRLHVLGAGVEVVARSPEDEADLDSDGENETKEMSGDVANALKKCSTRYWQKHKGHPVSFIHSKYLLVDGPYKQDSGAFAHQKLVWLGSPNMTKAAIEKSFEVLLKIKDDQIAYSDFRGDFEHLKAYATDSAVPLGQS